MADTVNKVEVNGETIIDLSNDTVTEETLDEGVTAHDATGASIIGARKKTYDWDDITGKPFTAQPSDTLEWNGTDYIEEWNELYKITNTAPALNAESITGKIVITSVSGDYSLTVEFPSDDCTVTGSNTSFDLRYKGYWMAHVAAYPYEYTENGIYLGKNTFWFADSYVAEGYVSSITIDGAEIGTKEVINTSSLPDAVVLAERTKTADMVLVSDGAGGAKWVTKSEITDDGTEDIDPPSGSVQEVEKVSLPVVDGEPDYGTAGQFAVSDGNGGITWLSLTNVSQEGA